MKLPLFGYLSYTNRTKFMVSLHKNPSYVTLSLIFYISITSGFEYLLSIISISSTSILFGSTGIYFVLLIYLVGPALLRAINQAVLPKFN